MEGKHFCNMKDAKKKKLLNHITEISLLFDACYVTFAVRSDFFFSSPQPWWSPHPVCFGESVFPSCLCSGSLYEDIWASVRILPWKTLSKGRNKCFGKFLKYLRKWKSWRSEGENVILAQHQTGRGHSFKRVRWHTHILRCHFLL